MATSLALWTLVSGKEKPDSPVSFLKQKSWNMGSSGLLVLFVSWHFYRDIVVLAIFSPSVSVPISVFSLLTFSALKQKLKRERTHTSPLCNSLYFFSLAANIPNSILFPSLQSLEVFITLCFQLVVGFTGKRADNVHLLFRSNNQKQFEKQINKCLIAWHQQRFPLTLHP